MEKLLKKTDAMMEAGEKVLSDPNISEAMKRLVRREMENHQHCLDVLGISDANRRPKQKNPDSV